MIHASVRGALFDSCFGLVVGLSAGLAFSAVLVARGLSQLDGVEGAAIHYGAALGLAALMAALPKWRAGARPWRATAVVAVLVTFAMRRWLLVWVDQEPLGWHSGPAGVSAAIVFGIEGALLGVLLAVDARAAQ